MHARTQKRSSFKIYAWIIGLVVVILVGSKAFHSYWLHTPPVNSGEHFTTFEIEVGDSGKTVAENLKEKGLITSSWAFYWTIRQDDLASQIQAGRFNLSSNMTPLEIIAIITEGGGGQVTVTIPEGWTIQKIDDRLFGLGLIEDDEFVECAQNCDFLDTHSFLAETSGPEGYLFPDTYFVDPSSFTVEGFIERLLSTFEQKVLTDENLTSVETSGRTLDEIIIAASIIEREVIIEKDKAMVSDIIWKRYDNGWYLGMCSTINYITGESTITYEDTQIDSPYNTYQNLGFPPSAIANPGLSSIDAALHPEPNPYWFFLNASETGETIYSQTNEEHVDNKAKWLD